jgi:hypothetical protein
VLPIGRNSPTAFSAKEVSQESDVTPLRSAHVDVLYAFARAEQSEGEQHRPTFDPELRFIEA